MTESKSGAWDRVHPQVRAGLETYLAQTNGGINALPDIADRRVLMNSLRQAAPPSPFADLVDAEDVLISPSLRVRTHRPKVHDGPLPAVLLIHGGGMVMGSADNEDQNATMLAHEVPAFVAAVDYRLAPEDPYPAALDDCYAALEWLAGNAATLGVDAARIAIYGQSAGGGLAAGLALLARDRGGPAICLQMLVYPMLDDRNVTASSHAVLDLGVWDRHTNIEAWQAYLGGLAGDDIPGYAAPTRATDLSGLPPAYLDVGDVDLFRDEDLDYASRLMGAGIPTELHVYPGGVHATQTFAPEAEIGPRTVGYRLDALVRALRPE